MLGVFGFLLYIIYFIKNFTFCFYWKTKKSSFPYGRGWGSWWSVHVYPFDRLQWLQSLNILYKSKLILCTLKLPTIIIVFSTRRAYVKIYKWQLVNSILLKRRFWYKTTLLAEIFFVMNSKIDFFHNLSFFSTLYSI